MTKENYILLKMDKKVNDSAKSSLGIKSEHTYLWCNEIIKKNIFAQEKHWNTGCLKTMHWKLTSNNYRTEKLCQLLIYHFILLKK